MTVAAVILGLCIFCSVLISNRRIRIFRPFIRHRQRTILYSCIFCSSHFTKFTTVPRRPDFAPERPTADNANIDGVGYRRPDLQSDCQSDVDIQSHIFHSVYIVVVEEILNSDGGVSIVRSHRHCADRTDLDGVSLWAVLCASEHRQHSEQVRQYEDPSDAGVARHGRGFVEVVGAAAQAGLQ